MSSTALFRPDTEITERKIAQNGPVFVNTGLGKISLRVTRDLEDLKDLWELMQTGAPCTSAQTYGWALAWTRHVLVPEGRDAAVAIGYGADGMPLFLLPFEIEVSFGLRVLKWLGQDHANYNMGLFLPVASQGLSAKDLSSILREAARQTGAAAAVLDAQPMMWDGAANPFMRLGHQRSPNAGYAIALGDFTALYERRFSKRSRGTLERKERRLRELGPLHYGWAESPEEKVALLETFFAQKARQFAAMGITNIFDGHARAFYRELALLDEDNPARLRLGYVKLEDSILATFSGTVCQNRMGVILSSLAEGELQRQSPGALLMRHQIQEACDVGLAYFDLGVGKARHKDEWCNIVQDLFDSFIAFSPQGLLVTLPLSVTARLKRAVKSNPHLWSVAQKIRTLLHGQKI